MSYFFKGELSVWLQIISEPKSVRKTLRDLQDMIHRDVDHMDSKEGMLQWSHLQELITSMDIQRPVNLFGKHCRCTDNCECEKWYR